MSEWASNKTEFILCFFYLGDRSFNHVFTVVLWSFLALLSCWQPFLVAGKGCFTHPGHPGWPGWMRIFTGCFIVLTTEQTWQHCRMTLYKYHWFHCKKILSYHILHTVVGLCRSIHHHLFPVCRTTTYFSGITVHSSNIIFVDKKIQEVKYFL